MHVTLPFAGRGQLRTSAFFVVSCRLCKCCCWMYDWLQKYADKTVYVTDTRISSMYTVTSSRLLARTSLWGSRIVLRHRFASLLQSTNSGDPTAMAVFVRREQFLLMALVIWTTLLKLSVIILMTFLPSVRRVLGRHRIHFTGCILLFSSASFRFVYFVVFQSAVLMSYTWVVR